MRTGLTRMRTGRTDESRLPAESSSDHARAQSGHSSHGSHEPSSWILRALETNLNIASFFCSFALLFWLREAAKFPYQISMSIWCAADAAGTGSLSIYSAGDAAFIVVVTAAILLLMFAPYAVLLLLTLWVIEEFTLSEAIANVDGDIMGSIERENEKAGDYVSAMLLVRNHLARTVLPEHATLEKVKERLVAQIKLGEMYWRYRAVLPGESPLQLAVETLTEARSLCERFIEESKPALVDLRAEMAQLAQGLAVARLVHNKTRDEDALIEKLLREALELREELEDHIGRAETLNSLGSLRMKHKRYVDAETYLVQMVDLRQRKLPPQHPDLAQGYMSLGSLFQEVERYDEAHENMTKALEVYVAAFHPTHPKVAWAHEGIAAVLMAKGELSLAQASIQAALDIRREAQLGSDGHQLFTREIDKLERTNKELALKRKAKVGLKWRRAAEAKGALPVRQASAVKTMMAVALAQHSVSAENSLREVAAEAPAATARHSLARPVSSSSLALPAESMPPPMRARWRPARSRPLQAE